MNVPEAKNAQILLITESFRVEVEWMSIKLEISKEHADLFGDMTERTQGELGGAVYCWAIKAAGEINQASKERRPINLEHGSVEMIVRDSKICADVDDCELAPAILRMKAASWQAVVSVSNWLDLPVHAVVRAALWHTFWRWKDSMRVTESARKAQVTRARKKAEKGGQP